MGREERSPVNQKNPRHQHSWQYIQMKLCTILSLLKPNFVLICTAGIRGKSTNCPFTQISILFGEIFPMVNTGIHAILWNISYSEHWYPYCLVKYFLWWTMVFMLFGEIFSVIFKKRFKARLALDNYGWCNRMNKDE